MKNTTKKFLSMFLAVIMILSVIPVAYAIPENYPPEAEEFIDISYKLTAHVESNLYFYDGSVVNGILECFEFTDDAFMVAFNQASEEWLSYGYEDKYGYEVYYLSEGRLYDKLHDDEFLESIRVFNDIFKPVTDMIDELIESGEIVCILDYSEVIKAVYSPLDYYGKKAIESFAKPEAPWAEEYLQTMPEIEEEWLDYVNNTPAEELNQEEFDAIWRKGLPLAEKICNCLDGNHLFSEYISNGDATEEADGTKTAICDFCGTVDTVIDEGSKLDNNDNSKCSCSCHKSGIIAFIWKLLNFFYKLFGMNKTCACGVAHY